MSLPLSCILPALCALCWCCHASSAAQPLACKSWGIPWVFCPTAAWQRGRGRARTIRAWACSPCLALLCCQETELCAQLSGVQQGCERCMAWAAESAGQDRGRPALWPAAAGPGHNILRGPELCAWRLGDPAPAVARAPFCHGAHAILLALDRSSDQTLSAPAAACQEAQPVFCDTRHATTCTPSHVMMNHEPDS